MVGKLDLDLGEDYAFDIRRAKYVAEQQSAVIIDDPFTIKGPFMTAKGVNYWIAKDKAGACSIGFDIDTTPEPDIFIALNKFMQNDNIDEDDKGDVALEAMVQGCRV